MSEKKRIISTSNIKYLTFQEKKELFSKIDADSSRLAVRNKAIIYLAKYCAFRSSEIALLNLSDYNPYTRTVYCRRLKNSDNNTLEIVDPSVYSAVEQYYFERQKSCSDLSDCLFTSQKGTPISRKMLDVIIKKYCAQTSISNDKHHFHVLKHTRAMELIEYPETKLNDVQWWLGHKSIRSTMVYLNFTSLAMKHLFNFVRIHEGTCNNVIDLK